MVIADLTKDSDPEKIINETINHFQKINILVSGEFSFILQYQL